MHYILPENSTKTYSFFANIYKHIRI